ncbi:MAG: response regulator [Motiliproteus sp.]
MQLDETQALTEIDALLDRLGHNNDNAEQTVSELVETLHALAERYSEGEYQGISDALVLLSELIAPLQPSEHLDSEELLANAGLGIQQLVQSPNLAADPLLSCLADCRWPRPLASDDYEFLNEILMADLGILANAGSASIAGASAHQIAVSSLSSQMQGILLYQETARPADDIAIENLISALHLLSEACSEGDLAGFSDLFALYVELLQQLGEGAFSLRNDIASQLHQQLSTLVNQPSQQVIGQVLTTMTSPQWPEPLPADEIEFLQSLLNHDIKHLELSAAPDSPVEDDDQHNRDDNGADDSMANAVTPQGTIEVLTTTSCTEQVVADELTSTDAADEPASLTEKMRQTLKLQESLKQSELHDSQSLIDSLHQLIDTCSESDYVGFSDLFALYAELIQEAGDDAFRLSSEISQQLHQQLLSLINSPSTEATAEVLKLMSSDDWSQPLPIEDLEFLLPLLNEESSRLAKALTDADQVVTDQLNIEDVNDALPISADHSDEWLIAELALLADLADEPNSLAEATELGETAVVEATIETAATAASNRADADSKTPAKLDFLVVDFELLSKPQPAVDAAVVAMLSDSMATPTQQWQQLQSLPTAKLLNETSSQISALSRALDTVGLRGARFVADGLITNISWLVLSPKELTLAAVNSVKCSLVALENYLSDMADKGRRNELIDHCATLPCGLDVEQAAFLSGLLALASIQDPRSIERRTAGQDEISLNIEKDVDPELMSMLGSELPLLSEAFTLSLQSVTDHGDTESLRDAQRGAHTIKGLANMAGIRGLASLTHCLEDILEFLTEAGTLPGAALSEDLLAAGDCLSAMCESVTDNEAAPDNSLEYLQKIIDWHYLAKTEGIEAVTGNPEPDQQAEDQTLEQPTSAFKAATPAPETTVPEAPVATKAEQRLSSEAYKAEPSSDTLEGDDKETVQQQSMSVPINLLDSLFRIAAESTTLNSQQDEELTKLRRLTRSSRDRYRAMERVMVDLESSLNEYSHLNSATSQDESEFDPLEMDRYNELHSSISRLHEAAADVSEVSANMDTHIRQLSELHSSQSGLQKEALDNVIRTRMVPVSTISVRVQRILRQACRAAGKKARLVIEGEHVMIDSRVLSQLADPLMHIIRNAVDHGLETPHSRFEIDKPETGTITLSFQRDTDQIRICCRDDGAGINTERVLQQALSKGLITADQQLTDQQINQLILMPGFSTREQISHLSGRGIGMDMVSQRVAALHGRLQIESIPGQGTYIKLALPSSSLMVRALLVLTGSQVVALSTQGIEQSLLSIDGSLCETAHGLIFETAEQSYRTLTLESLTDKPAHDYHRGQIHPVLIVNLGQGEQVAVLVREIVAHRELIFKEMGEQIPAIPGVPGITILSNGEVAPVIDLPTRVLHGSHDKLHTDLMPLVEQQRLPKIMVVDDSISARKTLITLLRDLGYEVHSAIDGLDAMNKIRKEQPDLLLTDYEMPRMNGIELASSVQAREETQNIPIIMITSRSTSKHRLEASNAGVSHYMTKPWNEATLLNTIEELLDA